MEPFVVGRVLWYVLAPSSKSSWYCLRFPGLQTKNTSPTHNSVDEIGTSEKLTMKWSCVYNVALWYLWFYTRPGLPVVLKFLKFHRYPEILLILSECPEIDLCYAVVTALPLFCTLYLFNWTLSVLLAYLLTTISPYVHYSFMCNISLVTLFGLQYWSASMN